MNLRPLALALAACTSPSPDAQDQRCAPLAREQAEDPASPVIAWPDTRMPMIGREGRAAWGCWPDGDLAFDCPETAPGEDDECTCWQAGDEWPCTSAGPNDWQTLVELAYSGPEN